MNKNSKILITGAEGMVGKNLIEELKSQGFTKLIFIDKNNLNLLLRQKVFNFFKESAPEYVFHLASKVGGIKDNLENPVEFLRDNLLINTNVIDACFKTNVKKLIILNSATIYPKNKEYPDENHFFIGQLEKENEAYGLSKIYAIKLCDYYNKEYQTNFINLASTNIYGKYSKFDSEKSNVIAALISRFHKAKIDNKEKVIVWGTGNVLREIIHARDLAKLLILSMKKINQNDCIKSLLNCGLGDEHSIKEIAKTIKKTVGFSGELKFDANKPEGVKKRTMNSSKFNSLIKFDNQTPLEKGFKEMYKYYLSIEN